jgi:hypothetical protein
MTTFLWYYKAMLEPSERMKAWMVFLMMFGMAFLLSSSVMAKPWKGTVPGKTSRAQVIRKFGAPTKEFSKGGKLSDGINYQGDGAIEGSLETNFYFDKKGILFRIDVFPSREIKKADILRVYGKDYAERVTEKGFVFFNYWREGMVIFFGKDSEKVHSVMFIEPVSGSKKPK